MTLQSKAMHGSSESACKVTHTFQRSRRGAMCQDVFRVMPQEASPVPQQRGRRPSLGSPRRSGRWRSSTTMRCKTSGRKGRPGMRRLKWRMDRSRMRGALVVMLRSSRRRRGRRHKRNGRSRRERGGGGEARARAGAGAQGGAGAGAGAGAGRAGRGEGERGRGRRGGKRNLRPCRRSRQRTRRSMDRRRGTWMRADRIRIRKLRPRRRARQTMRSKTGTGRMITA